MNRTISMVSYGTLERMSDPLPVDGVKWLIPRTSLVALADLGLSPRQIAEYFSVMPADVSRLLKAKHAQGGR